jgi:phage-related holin
MKTITSLFIAISLFLLPIQGLILTMILFISLDTITALYVTIRLKGWKSFQSTKFFNIVVKSFFYLASITLAFTIDNYIFEGSVMGIKLLLAKSMTAVWVFNEIKSCDENSVKLGNKPFFDMIKELLGKMKQLKKDLNEITNG